MRAPLRIVHPARTAGPNRWWHSLVIGVIVVVCINSGNQWLERWTEFRAHAFGPLSTEPFPATGTAQWFVSIEQGNQNALAPFTITAPKNSLSNVVVILDNWDDHRPVVQVAVRAGDTAQLLIPFGRYRMSFAKAAVQHGEYRPIGEKQEGVEPLQFYHSNSQVIGHKVDLNGYLNGNLRTRRSE